MYVYILYNHKTQHLQIFKHTFNFFNHHASPAQPLNLQVSFGKGPSGFWTNCFPSKLVAAHSSDIKRFGLFLTVIKWTMPLLGLVPISVMLRLFFFSKDFGDKMVYPLIALFLGTGNQTANVPAAIVERLFNDPNMKLWDYDKETLLPNQPTMYSFDCLHDFYGKWKDSLVAKGVDIRTNTEVHRVLSRSSKGVDLAIKNNNADDITNEHFDHLVLCVLADDALRILADTATGREKRVLGSATFYDDLTVTHSDSAYFNRQYETHFKSELCAEPKSEEQCHQIATAKGESISSSSSSPSNSSEQFNPMYYTYTYQHDPRLIEMSFNCSNYQHQFKKSRSSSEVQPEPVYQTIFLDKRKSDLWTVDGIDENKIIKRNWWHQLGHRWQHYVRVVPCMMFLQGRNNTFFAGSWTLVVCYHLSLFHISFYSTTASPFLSFSLLFELLLSSTHITETNSEFSTKRQLILTLNRTCTKSPASAASQPPTASAQTTPNSTTLPKTSSQSIYCFLTASSFRERKRRGNRAKQFKILEKNERGEKKERKAAIIASK